MPFYQNQRKAHSGRFRPYLRIKGIDIARTDEMSKTQLETMANEDASFNSVNQRKPKPEQT